MSTFVLVNFVTLFWCHLMTFIVLCGYNEFDVSKRLQDSHYPQNGHYQWDSNHIRMVTILRMVFAPKLKTTAKMKTISYLFQNDHSLSLGQWPIVTSMVTHLYHDGHPPSPRCSATITKTVNRHPKASHPPIHTTSLYLSISHLPS